MESQNQGITQKKKIVIVGAGCTGLAAGVALLKQGHAVTLIERLGRVGGLAGGIEIKGNVYEYGPHIFHTTDPEVLAEVKRIAGHVLLPFEKTIKIKFLGNYFDFPLSMKDILFKLPPHTVLHAALSFIFHFFNGLIRGKSSLSNSEKVLQRYYGDVLYRIFFRDYITQVWGIEPRGMSASFAEQRVPRLNFIQVMDQLKKKLFPKQKKEIALEKFVEKVEGEAFTTKKGFSLITEAFVEEFVRLGGQLKLKSTLSKIRTSNSLCQSVSFKSENQGMEVTIPCDGVISTLPVNSLPSLLEPLPPLPVLRAASTLKFRGIVFVSLLINKKTALPASFMYFRDKSFNRITDLGQFKVEIYPPGATILIAEITCQPTDSYWRDELDTIQKVIAELVAENLIHRDEVLESHVFKSEHGYPIYSVGYENDLEALRAGLRTYKNLISTGRQGEFAYINTHVAIKMGFGAAKKFNE